MGQNARHQSDCRIFETLISQKLFEIKCSFFLCSQISMEALVKSCNIVGFGQACPGMPNFLQNNKCQYLWEGLSYFVYLLHLVTHLFKLQCHHAILVGYGPASPKFSQITNRQYFWKRFSDFFDFLQVVEATKICYFGLALSGIGSQPIRLSDVLKFKNSKTT